MAPPEVQAKTSWITKLIGLARPPVSPGPALVIGPLPSIVCVVTTSPYVRVSSSLNEKVKFFKTLSVGVHILCVTIPRWFKNWSLFSGRQIYFETLGWRKEDFLPVKPKMEHRFKEAFMTGCITAIQSLNIRLLKKKNFSLHQIFIKKIFGKLY